jgi:hypothetical protein
MSALLSMGQQFSGLPMKSLISTPLMAAAEANGNMARMQVQFMLSTCFNKEGEELKPIMITFKSTRPVIDKAGNSKDDAETTIIVPLLTMIPLNSLAVDNVKVNFEMEVKSSTSKDNESSSESDKKFSADITAKVSYGIFSAEAHASVSASSKTASSQKEHYEASNTARYEVEVHAGQLPLPKGVTTIIDAFAKNIAPIMVNADSGNTEASTPVVS